MSIHFKAVSVHANRHSNTRSDKKSACANLDAALKIDSKGYHLICFLPTMVKQMRSETS